MKFMRPPNGIGISVAPSLRVCWFLTQHGRWPGEESGSVFNQQLSLSERLHGAD